MKLRYLLNHLILLYFFFMNIETVFAIDRNLKAKSDQVLSDPIGASHFFQMFLGLFLIVLLIFGLAWLIKRVNSFQGNVNGALKVLSMMSVGQKEKIVLIQIGKKQLLVGVAQGNINTLLILDELIENRTSENHASTFSDKLSAVLKGKVVEK